MTVMELSFWIMDILPAELRTHEFVSHILEMKAPLEITRGPEVISPRLLSCHFLVLSAKLDTPV
jgi:hypothetical protein